MYFLSRLLLNVPNCYSQMNFQKHLFKQTNKQTHNKPYSITEKSVAPLHFVHSFNQLYNLNTELEAILS